MTTNVEQALVLVGGKASRLIAGGVAVPLSKAFMEVAGKPLLHWNLHSLHAAGVRRLVIAAHETRLQYQASKTVTSHPCKFDRVDYFHDEGNGVHGVPYELRYLLEETFVFECGHSLSRPEHYMRLMRSKKGYNVVFSAFKAHPKNKRQPVGLKKDGKVSLASDNHFVIAHPIVADRQYAGSLLKLHFTIGEIIAHYAGSDALPYVMNDMPPEYDIADEMKAALATYEHYLAKLAII